MLPVVNFLPWRQRRRTACVRFWGVMFSASAIMALAIVLAGYATRSLDEQASAALSQAENQLATALTAARPQLQQRQLQRQQAIAREKQRQATRRWQPALESLARRLPAEAWLTSIDYQQNTLQLSGKTLTFAALGALETALRDWPLWQITHTGAAQQDTQGYWQFSYRLVWSETDARSR